MPTATLIHSTDQEEAFHSLRGHDFCIRPLAAADREALADFVRRLSPESRRLRFFTPVKNLDPALLEHLVDVDFHDRAAFVATLNGLPDIQAVGRYEVTGPGVAEIAFSVADALQGEGIGTELLHHLAAHARGHGIHEFTADVLSENFHMLDVFRHSGYAMASHSEAGVCSVTLSLAENL